MHAGGVVGVELLEDRRARGGGAGDGDALADARAGGLGDRLGEDLRRLGLEQLELLGARRVGAQEALGLADDAGLGGGVEVDGGAMADDELGGAAADVDDDAGVVVLASVSVRSLVAPR